MLLPSILIVATAWTFHSAPLAADETSGNEIAAGVHTLRVPSRGGCGWWSTNATIAPKGGVRFRATVEIAMDDVRDFVHNDFAMFVRWDFPKDGKDRSKSGNGVDKGKFYQRDFIAPIRTGSRTARLSARSTRRMRCPVSRIPSRSSSSASGMR